MPLLRIDVAARIAEFLDGLDNMQRSSERTARQIENSFKGVNSVLRALGVGLSIAGITAFIKGAIDAADRLNDLNKITGISVEQLAGLSLAAKQSGGDLESIATSVNKLSQNIGKAPDKFRALGVTAKDPLEAFKQLADIFSKIEDPQLRAALGAEALGKNWAGAAPLLAEGSKKIQELVDKGTKLSGITKEDAERADEFNDKLEELKTQSLGAATNISRFLLPGLLDTAKAMSDLAKEGNPVLAILRGFAGLGRIPLDLLVPNFTDAEKSARVLADLEGKAKNLREAISGGFRLQLDPQALEQTRNKLSAIENQIKIVKDRAAGVGASKSTEAATDPKAAAEAAARAGRFVGGDGKGGGAARSQRDEFAETLAKASLARLKQIEQAEEDAAKAAQDLQQKLDALISNTPIEQARKLQENVDFLNKALGEGRVNPETYKQAIDSLLGVVDDAALKMKEVSAAADSLISQTPIERTKELQAVIDELNRRMSEGVITADQFNFAIKKALDVDEPAQKTSDALKDLGATFSSALEDAITNGKKFSDILKGLEKDIIRIVTRKLVTEPLAEKISGFLGGSGAGDIFSSLGKFFGFAHGGIMTSSGPMPLERYAFGGVANRPQLAMFGEGSRPEAFVPLPDGRRIPVHMQTDGGAPLIQNFHIAATTSRETQGQLAAAAMRGAMRHSRRNN